MDAIDSDQCLEPMMVPEEKQQLLGLLDHENKWCQNAEAQDGQGNPVRYDDNGAVAWDITGALCRLFGWPRACVLFEQIDRHVNGERQGNAGPRNIQMDAMAALQDFNDNDNTTFDALRERIESMPVWHGQPASG